MIDNAIIVIDNIRQQQQLGLPLSEACIKGGNEVIRPLVSSALTTCSVFLPLIFLSGIAGTLFYDQAISISIALATSLIVSFVLLPTLASLILKKNSAVISESDWLQKSGNTQYAKSVDFFLANRWWVGLLFIGLIGSGILCYLQLQQTAFPNLSRNGLEIQIDWNEPISLKNNEAQLKTIKRKFGQLIENNSFLVGEQQFFLERQRQLTNESTVLMYTPEGLDLEALSQQIRAYFKQSYPNAILEIQPLQNLFDQIFDNEGLPLVAHIQNMTDQQLPSMTDLAPLFNQLEVPLVIPPKQQEINILIDREKAVLYGVQQETIVDQLKTLFSDNQISTLQSSSQAIPIVLGTTQAPLNELINHALIENNNQAKVPLSSFIRIERQEGSKMITASRAGESFDIGFPVFNRNLMQKIKSLTNQYPNLSVYFSGRIFEDKKLINELLVILGISILLLYLILAAQFESLIQPLIVILTIPLGISGSLFVLFLFNESINLISLIGMVVMGGIMVNDAILKIDMMNHLTKKYTLIEAIHGAGKRRLRPILMTSLTTILALTPILFSSGLGAELQRPLAFAVIGGLIIGTLTSLYIIPILYKWITPTPRV